MSARGYALHSVCPKLPFFLSFSTLTFVFFQASSASASVLVQCGACLALSLLIPVLVSSDQAALIRTIISRLVAGLQMLRRPASLYYCNGLGLGLVLASLRRANYDQIASEEVGYVLAKYQIYAYRSIR